jgi:hypothetical protein
MSASQRQRKLSQTSKDLTTIFEFEKVKTIWIFRAAMHSLMRTESVALRERLRKTITQIWGTVDVRKLEWAESLRRTSTIWLGKGNTEPPVSFYCNFCVVSKNFVKSINRWINLSKLTSRKPVFVCMKTSKVKLAFITRVTVAIATSQASTRCMNVLVCYATDYETSGRSFFQCIVPILWGFIILSRVRGSVTNNNGFCIGWLELLALLLQLRLITITYNSSQLVTA